MGRESFDFSPTDMESAGKALYGECWQSALAHALGVDSRRVRQWMAGERKPQVGVMHDIITLLEANQQQSTMVIRKLRKKYYAKEAV